jgi:elongation factor G
MGGDHLVPHRIRTVALLGQGGAGKTALGEGLLTAAGAASRGGVLDSAEERERGHSLSLSTAALDWRECRVHVIDTPGTPDFAGEAYPALSGADCALFVVDAVDGVQPVHDALWKRCDALGLPRIVVLSGLDKERAGYQAHVDALRQRCGKPLAPVHMPLGLGEEFTGVIDLLHQQAVTRVAGERTKGPVPHEHAEQAEHNRRLLVEAIVETDDELLEAYLEGEEPAAAALGKAFAHGIATCQFFPLLCVSVEAGLGLRLLADFLVDECPSPLDRPVASDGDGHAVDPAEGPLALQVIKTRSDRYLGRISVARVLAGQLEPDQEAVVARTGATTRLHHLLWLQGDAQHPCGGASAGDLVAVPKLEDVETGDTLRAPGSSVTAEAVTAPKGQHRVAIQPAAGGDEEKLSGGLARLTEEDPALTVDRAAETGQLVLATAGPEHAQACIQRLRQRFGASVDSVPLAVAYRETLAGPAEATGKLKKQTGGAGQFAIAVIEAEPLERGAGFEFHDRIVGGVIPKTYIPSVEKGVRAAMAAGVLAGYPVVDVKVSLVDGKTHSVDSSQMAFETAGSLAFREAASAAGLLLLEPIMAVTASVPDDQVGDVMGDLAARRGRILGTEPIGGGRTQVRAHVPEAELTTVVPELRALTHGAGSVSMAFDHYDVAPDHVAA